MAMTAKQKRNTTIAVIAVIALILLLGGAAIAAGGEEDDDKPKDIPPPPDCPEGKKAIWSLRRMEWQCVDVDDPQAPEIECPPGFHPENGECVANDPDAPPPAQECPEGQTWNSEQGKCVPLVPQCPTGFHFDIEAQECVPDFVIPGGPTGPAECPEGTHYDATQKKCIADEPGAPKPGVIVVPGDPNDYIKPYPIGRNFYQVVQGDIAYGTFPSSIVYRYLLNEAFFAAKEDGASDDEADEFKKLVAKNFQNRIDAWQLITCAGTNDACYATWGYDPKFDPDPGPAGRAIRLVAQHPNNLLRLQQWQDLARCVRIGSAATKGNGNGVRVNDSCHSYELLWMPGLNRQVIRTSVNLTTGRVTITTNGMTWPNGDSMGLPPPFILDRGVTFMAGSVPEPIPTSWGCLNVNLELG